MYVNNEFASLEMASLINNTNYDLTVVIEYFSKNQSIENIIKIFSALTTKIYLIKLNKKLMRFNLKNIQFISNYYLINKSLSKKIEKFHKKSSTEMFRNFESDQKIDLLHLDGRLQNEDYDLLKNNFTKKTILILDDFEGNEKGVVNLFTLLNHNVINRNTHCVIYPIENEVSKNYNLLERSSSAFILPIKLLKITNQ